MDGSIGRTGPGVADADVRWLWLGLRSKRRRVPDTLWVCGLDGGVWNFNRSWRIRRSRPYGPGRSSGPASAGCPPQGRPPPALRDAMGPPFPMPVLAAARGEPPWTRRFLRVLRYRLRVVERKGEGQLRSSDRSSAIPRSAVQRLRWGEGPPSCGAPTAQWAQWAAQTLPNAPGRYRPRCTHDLEASGLGLA